MTRGQHPAGTDSHPATVCRGARRILAVALTTGAIALASPVLGWAADARPGPGAAQLAQLLFGLVLVVGAVFLFGRLLPRIAGVRGSNGVDMRVVASLAVGQKERVVLLQVGNQQLLLGVTPTQVNTLQALAEPLRLSGGDTAASDPGAAGWLARTLARKS